LGRHWRICFEYLKDTLMQNIGNEKLQNIASDINDLLVDLESGISWSDKNTKEPSNQTSYTLKSYRRNLKKINKAITQKPTIAIFGRSQQGKSYLVNNILGDESNKLKMCSNDANEQEYDFMADFNPIGGGSEATGLVTRFSYSNNTVNLLPVKLKIFRPIEIFIILSESYLADIQSKTYEPTNELIRKHLDKLLEYYSSTDQSMITEDDVYEFEEYLNKMFCNNAYLKPFSEGGADYWRTVADNIYKIPVQNWVEVFKPLWGCQEQISSLASKLIDGVNSLNYNETITGGFDLLLRGKGELLNVTTKMSLQKDNGSFSCLVNLNNGDRVEIGNSLLSAITAEVILNIPEESIKDEVNFLKETDLLDFPGARAREAFSEVNLSKKQIYENLLIRGKVSYLFNMYTQNYGINNLFTCFKEDQTEDKTLPPLINSWIEFNIGKDKKEREQSLKNTSIPPLYVILTFWNKNLEFPKNQNNSLSDIEAIWYQRFDRRVKSDVFDNQFTWGDEWTETSKFKNYYLLRDFTFSDDTFTGFEQTGKEISVREDRSEYYTQLKESFINSAYTKSLFENPEESWNETATPNNDGINSILTSVNKTANNIAKSEYFVNKLTTYVSSIVNDLKHHFHDDEKDNIVNNAIRTGSEVHSKMNLVFGENTFLFGSFIDHLTVSEDDIFKFYHEILKSEKLNEQESANKYTLIRTSTPGLSSLKSFDENVSVLRNYYNLESDQEVINKYESDNVDLNELFYGEAHDLKNRSLTLAEEARNFWFADRLNIDNFETFTNAGFDKVLLEKIFSNLKISFNELRLTKIIAESICDYVDRYDKLDQTEEMIAHMTAGIINEFICSAGWTYYTSVKKEEIKATNKKNDLNLNIPDESDPVEDKVDVVKLFDLMDNMNEVLNEKPLDEDKIRFIPMIKNYRNWTDLLKISFLSVCDIPDYDPEINAQLGRVIDNINLYNFSL